MEDKVEEITQAQKKEALSQIENKLSDIDKLYEECVEIAEKFQVDFSVGGPSYGMGGGYMPRNIKVLLNEGYIDEDELEGMDQETIDEYLDEHTGWQASSQSC